MQKYSKEFEVLRRAGFQKWVDGLRAKQGDRFWKRVKIGERPKCWEFIGSISKGGYGRASFNGRVINAHQVAYIFTYGDYDRSLDVCHKCDNRPCCNPNHLWLGTRSENLMDMWQKGRHPANNFGEQAGGVILTEREVLEIRRRHSFGDTQRSIAVQFKVNWRTINLIVLRKNWTHI